MTSDARRTRAPGKLVLSGSYSVLYGAPAIVTATGRFAYADRERAPVHVAEEVVAAVERGLIPAPCFVDASELRAYEPDGTSRKLGLGSSAAILLATLVAYRGAPKTEAARRELFEQALLTHRLAQGGGSGVDVAASTFGGTLRFLANAAGTPDVTAQPLPADAVITVFAARTSAVTAGFVARVKAYASSSPERFGSLMNAASAGAASAVAATSAGELVRALKVQRDSLRELGVLSGVPIVTPEVHDLAAAAGSAFFGPSGAGGGDVAFFLSDHPAPSPFIEAARRLGYDALDCAVGAPGASEITG
jgi:phosphomevalonate kinase